MTKPIREWFQELDEEPRDKALANFDKYVQDGILNKNTSANSLPEALISAFYWDNTPEKFKYWMKIYENLP